MEAGGREEERGEETGKGMTERKEGREEKGEKALGKGGE